ncbi:MAG TPA: hypothetical protein DCZ92_01645 [Elusimicrobia bacterium]|nr:MAG: hypothetical protein A2016_12270 [Elusimicrobia bacterium GWF2_62_30]HBA59530.1 hypothetical protein [Elusimicrobiota bacterium]
MKTVKKRSAGSVGIKVALYRLYAEPERVGSIPEFKARTEKTMKKLMIAAAAVVGIGLGFAQAGDIVDFDGKGAGARSFMEKLNKASDMQCRVVCERPGDCTTICTPVNKTAGLDIAAVSAPVQVAEAVIPARRFDAAEIANMDRSIGTAIAYVQSHKQGAPLAASFECLRNSGTPEQKFAFVYKADAAPYSFPENCVRQDKGICSWVVESVCTTITVVSCAWVTSGDNPPITKKECHDESKEDCKKVKSWICD